MTAIDSASTPPAAEKKKRGRPPKVKPADNAAGPKLALVPPAPEVPPTLTADTGNGPAESKTIIYANPDADRRTARRREKDGTWTDIPFLDLRTGDVFSLFESDGAIENGVGGVWLATSDPYAIEGGRNAIETVEAPTAPVIIPDDIKATMRGLWANERQMAAIHLYRDTVEGITGTRPELGLSKRATEAIVAEAAPPADFVIPEVGGATPEPTGFDSAAFDAMEEEERRSPPPARTPPPRRTGTAIIGEKTREVQYTLTPEEFIAVAHRLANDERDINAEIALQTVQKSEMRERLSALKGQQARDAAIVRDGVEVRTVRVLIEADYDNNTVREITAEDGQVVETRPLEERERQLPLFPAVTPPSDAGADFGGEPMGDVDDPDDEVDGEDEDGEPCPEPRCELSKHSDDVPHRGTFREDELELVKADDVAVHPLEVGETVYQTGSDVPLEVTGFLDGLFDAGGQLSESGVYRHVLVTTPTGNALEYTETDLTRVPSDHVE